MNIDDYDDDNVPPTSDKEDMQVDIAVLLFHNNDFNIEKKTNHNCHLSNNNSLRFEFGHFPNFSLISNHILGTWPHLTFSSAIMKFFFLLLFCLRQNNNKSMNE